MFEEMTYEKIIERMLERVPDTLDKREGAIIFVRLRRPRLNCQFSIRN